MEETRCRYRGRCIYKSTHYVTPSGEEIILPICKKPPYIDKECPFETNQEVGKLVESIGELMEE